MKKDFNVIWEKFNLCKTEREKYVSLWDKISRYTGITLNTNYFQSSVYKQSNQLDEWIDDPTSALTVNQFGDYLMGLIWMENGFQGLEGQKIPEMTSEIINQISERYIELYENIVGEKFVRHETDNLLNRIETNLSSWLKTNR